MTDDTAANPPVRNSQTSLDAARDEFDAGRGEFRVIEDDFLQVIDELWSTDVRRLSNLATLDGLRVQLMASLDRRYRRAVNSLVDALLDSIGEPPVDRAAETRSLEARPSDGAVSPDD
jgi:hypothetical protein